MPSSWSWLATLILKRTLCDSYKVFPKTLHLTGNKINKIACFNVNSKAQLKQNNFFFYTKVKTRQQNLTLSTPQTSQMSGTWLGQARVKASCKKFSCGLVVLVCLIILFCQKSNVKSGVSQDLRSSRPEVSVY